MRVMSYFKFDQHSNVSLILDTLAVLYLITIYHIIDNCAGAKHCIY